MLSCKEANRLISQELDRKLSWSERFGLKLHVSMCDGCTNARNQMSIVHNACKHAFGLDDITNHGG